MPMNPFDNYFRVTTKKKHFRPKMATKCQFLPQISVIWVWVVSSYSPSPI